MTDTQKTYDKLRERIKESTLTIYREEESDQFILIDGNTIEQGGRIVAVGVMKHRDDDPRDHDHDVWFPISANEFHSAWDFGKNEVEWSGVTVDEAVELAMCAFEHEQYDGQPTVE